MYFLVPLASSSTATPSGSTATPSGSTVRTSGSTAPTVLLAFCLLVVVFQRATAALAVIPLLGALVPLGAGCEDNVWISPLLFKGVFFPIEPYPLSSCSSPFVDLI